jgi:hypothetical protein
MKLIATVLFAIFLASPAIAQPAKKQQRRDPNEMAATDCERLVAKGKKCKILKIEGEIVKGSTPIGDGTNVGVINFDDHASMIKLRKHFIPEIIKSAEDLD